MSLYKYTGEAGRVWPAVPVTPDVGDVVEWGDVVPDPLSWAPVKSGKGVIVRAADNATPEPAPELPADPPPAAATAPVDAPASESQE